MKYSLSKKNRSQGFTVLELLVIIGIISILMALVLVGLNAARSRSTDERKVAALRPVVIELQDYFSVCRRYPESISQTGLTTGTPCPDLVQQGKTIRDLLPSAYDLNFNATGSEYHYQALETNSLPGECTNFHVWVNLNNPGGALLQQKSNMSASSYAQYNLQACAGITQSTLTTNNDTVVDIFK